MIINPEQFFEEDKVLMKEDWGKMVAQLKEKTTLPSQIAMDMFQKCFEAGWASGSVQTLRHFVAKNESNS